MENKINLLEILEHINPSILDYTEWVNVGMALKQEGYLASDWDDWSSRDGARYKPGECFSKWDTFEGIGSVVTGGTIVQFAKDQGWQPKYINTDNDHALDWDDVITDKEDLVVLDKNWIEGQEIKEPTVWKPAQEIIKYLETLFLPSENVGYVTETYEKDGKLVPTKGASDRTAGILIEQLRKCNDDIGAVLGDYNEEAGAWVRFNPLDGKGVKNENVTDFRYALVESDNMDLEKQNAIMRELELPIAMLVHSGKKSIHAIVKVDAANYEDYRKKVDYLYKVCKKNGLVIDTQNRNPSRLSRLPGIIRNGKKQYIIDTHIGKETFEEWTEWIEAANDDLPDPESLTDFWDTMPELAPTLIEGVLRQGHKMLMAGPSKAGKSFALIELCIAIAEGTQWLGWNCTQGKVLYVNLELDRASCLHRFRDVYQGLQLPPKSISNIDIWNLRGKTVPLDKLVPKLLRRASKKGYIAVIIDPIYKVLTGDENSAEQMAKFTNQFDKICTELGASAIYCHHHSKGGQGNKKSMDRASGSGVFARDPDALIDLVELELNENIIKAEENKAICKVFDEAITKYNNDYFHKHIGPDDILSAKQMADHAAKALATKEQKAETQARIESVKNLIKVKSAWRVEGTLREFPKFDPVNMWFEYPVHSVDETGVLKDIEPDNPQQPYKRNFSKKKTPEERKKEKNEAIELAYDACSIDEEVTIKGLTEYMGVSEKTVRRRLKEHGSFWVDEGIVGKKS